MDMKCETRINSDRFKALEQACHFQQFLLALATLDDGMLDRMALRGSLWKAVEAGLWHGVETGWGGGWGACGLRWFVLGLGSVWDRFGFGSGSVWNRFGIDMG
jgi:hypothetical protein